MPKFKDTSGQEWPVVINYDTIFRAKKANHPLPMKMEDMAVLADHLSDPMNLFDVLCIVCPLEAGGVTAEQFAGRLDGDAAHAAIIAVTEAAIDFFPQLSRGQKQALKAKHLKLLDLLSEKSVRTLESMKLDSDTPASSASAPATSAPTPSAT